MQSILSLSLSLYQQHTFLINIKSAIVGLLIFYFEFIEMYYKLVQAPFVLAGLEYILREGEFDEYYLGEVKEEEKRNVTFAGKLFTKKFRILRGKLRRL